MLTLFNEKIWLVTTVFIILMGVYLSFILKFRQFKLFKMLRELLRKRTNIEDISSFKTLMLSLAGRIGVGSIAGVALAIYIGGAGTIFWIWVITLLSAPITYAETYLGIKYRDKYENYGGVAYYIRDGLNNVNLGKIYAITIIICYIVGFVGIQANTITRTLGEVIFLSNKEIALILSIISFLIVSGGVKKITKVTAKIVPIMTIIYVLVAFYCLIVNVKIIPDILLIIILDAFKFKSISAGFLSTMLIGIERGIFSNEAGIGTASMAAASGSSNDAKEQGYIQMLGVYITSFLICTSSAIIVLTSNYKLLMLSDPNGIEIVTNAFRFHFGNFGNIILIISILLFAFSTILSGYYYGENSIYFLFNKKNKKYVFLLKILTMIIIFIGSFVSASLIWSFIDLGIAILTLINLYAIFKLRKKIG